MKKIYLMFLLLVLGAFTSQKESLGNVIVRFAVSNSSIPIVDSFPAVCLGSQPFALMPYVRSGTGSFSGPGVTANNFDPNIAGAGRHVLTFSYFDSSLQAFVDLYPTIYVQGIPNYTYSSSGSCLGAQLNFSLQDSMALFWDWYVDGQIVKRKYLSYDWQASGIVNQNPGLFAPEGMFVHRNGDVYIADTENHRVIKVSPSGTHTIVAGGNGDGPLLNQIRGPRGLFVDSAGALYVSESGNNRVTKWLPGASAGVVVAGAANGASGTALNRLNSPKGIWVQPNGDLLVVDMDNHRVMRWSSGATTGVRVAGTGISGSALNQLDYPWAIAMDTLGRMYISDINNRRILRYNANSTAGVLVAGGNGWGNGLNQFSNPFGLFVDRLGYVYVADHNNNRIMRWAPGSQDAEIIAGNGAENGSQGQLTAPMTPALDREGNLFVLDRNLGVQRFTLEVLLSDSIVASTKGNYSLSFSSYQEGCSFQSNSIGIFAPEVALTSSSGFDVCEGDTTLLNTQLDPTYVYQWFRDGAPIAGATSNTLTAFEPGLYYVEVLDSNACSRISDSMRIWPKPVATLTANGLCLGSELTTNAPDSNVVQIDWFMNNQLVKQTNRKYKEEGEPVLGNFNGWINNLPFHWGMGDFHIHTDGSIYITDMHDRRVVRYFPSTGQFMIVAGGNGEGNALNQLNNPQGIFVTANGDLFIADMNNHRVVRWSPGATQGVVVAGATSTAGTALNRLNHPSDVFIDQAGNLFIADNHNHRVVRWAPGATTGVLVAGTTGQHGGGISNLTHPTSIYVAADGRLYVADNHNHRIMRFNAGSTVGTVVAGGNWAGSGLNQLTHPHDIYVDGSNNVYVADLQNHRIVLWRPDATTGELVVGGFGSGSGLNQVPNPNAIKLGNGRELYVSMGGPRLTRFSLAEMPADTLLVTASGSYTTKFSTILGCENTSNTIDVPRLFGSDTVRVFGNDTLLAGLNGGAYQQYLWSTGSTDSALQVNSTGMYQLTATDTTNGCSREQQIFVYLGRASVVASETAVCEGTQARLSIESSQLSESVSWQPLQVMEVGGHNGSITEQAGDSLKIWGNSYNDPTYVILGSDSVLYGEMSAWVSMTSPNAIPDPKAFIGMAIQRRTLNGGGTTFSAGEGYLLSMMRNNVFLEDRLKSGNNPVVLASMSVPGLDFSVPHHLRMKIGIDDTLRCYLDSQEVFKHPVSNSSIQPGFFALGGHNMSYTFKGIRFGGTLSSILWSTGEQGPVIRPTITQDTTFGFTLLDGGFTTTGSKFIQVNPVPVVNLSSADSLTFCSGGSALLVADSVPGATYRWVQEDALVNDYEIRVYSVYGGTGNTNEYGGYPNSKEEFDRLFDTTFFNTSLHYQGRHPANHLFNWNNWQSLNNAGISIPNNGDYFSFLTSGYFIPKQSGIYQFRTISDDRSDIFIKDTLVFAYYNTSLNGRIYLDSGIRVPFVVRMQEYTGGESFSFSWLKPTDLSSNNWQLDTTELIGSAGTIVHADSTRHFIALQGGTYRAEVTTSTGCTVSSNGLQIEVLPLPNVSLASFSPVCLTDSITIQLSGGLPQGGTYSGPSVNNGVFDPLIAGAGVHEITYTYTDTSGNGCSNSAVQQLVVLPLTVNVQVDDYCAPGEAIASIGDSSVYNVQWFRNNQLIQERPIGYAFNAEPMLTGMSHPYDMHVDAQGNRFVVELHAHRVVRYAAGQSAFTVVAGGNGNGSALNQLNNPTGLTVDAAGNVYVADHSNHRVVRWAPGATQGVVVAGSALGVSGSGNNQLNHPYHVKFDGQGRLYVSDRDNHRVLRYSATVSTTNTALAGTVIVGAAGNGSANNQLSGPHALYMDVEANRMYLSDDNNARIMRYDLTASNVANSGTRVAGGNGHGAQLNQFSHHISGILLLGTDLYLADLHGQRIMRWKVGAPSGEVIAGGTGYGPELFRVSRPTALRIDAQGNLEYLERDHARLVRFAAQQINSDTLAFTEAGTYRAEFKRFGLNCTSVSANLTINKPIAQISSSEGATVCEGDTTSLSTPNIPGYVYQWYKDGLSIAGANTHSYATSMPGVYTVETGDSSGCYFTSGAFTIHAEPHVNFIADGLCLGSTLTVSTTDSNVVGFDWFRNGSMVNQVRAGFEEEGEPFVAANTSNLFGLNQPFDLATDHLGNIYYSEHGNHRVVRRAPDGSSPLVVAGNGSAGAGLSSLDRPTGIFVDAALNVYVADMGNHRVVKWAPGATQGVLVAGTSGVAGSTLARLNDPMDVVVDDSGAVYVADRNNHRVVKWLPNATTGTLFAGTGTSGASINQLSEPHGLAIWGGAVYIADHWNGRVIRVFNGVNSIVASNMPIGDQRISSVHLDKTGAIYLSELFNNRVTRWFQGASTGEIVAGGNANGNAANQLGQQIYGITTDLQGNLYVADGIWNQRIMKYNRVLTTVDSFIPMTAGTYSVVTHTVQGCSYQHSGRLQILSPEVHLTSSAGREVCEGDTTILSTTQDATYTYQWFKDGVQIAGATASNLTAFEPGIYHVEVLDSNACSRVSESMRIWPKPDVILTANGLCLGSELTTNAPDSNVVQIDWFMNNQLVKQTNRKYKEEGEPVLGNFNGWINNLPFHWGMGDFHIHTDGSIYITDMHDRRVVRYFPSTGQFTVVAGGNGAGNGLNQLGDNPRGVFVTNNGDVYVADPSNHRVVKWEPNATQGVLVAGVTSTAGSQLSRLNLPWDVVVDDNGNVYISDDGNHRIVRWAPGATQGVVVAGLTGQAGSSLNQLNGPKGIFVNKQGQLFIADYANHRVLRYNQGSTSGTVVAGGSGAGASLNQIHETWDVYVDEANSVYVADYHNHRVIRWAENATEGEVVAGGAGGGNGLNQTTHPYAISKFRDGGIYVVSSNWLKRFDLDDMPADTLNAEDAGNYSVRMRTLQGCENNSQSHIIFAPEVSLSSTRGFDVCEGDTTILSTIQDSTYTYQWFRDGVQIAGATASNLTAFEPGLYHVEVLDSNACSRVSESMRIWPKPDVTLTANGLCLGSELITNIPDSNVIQIDWFRNNQLVKQLTRKYLSEGEPVVGNFNGWINNLPFHWGMGDFHIHNDGSIYISDIYDRRVVRYFPSTGQFTVVAGGNGSGGALNQLENPQGVFVTANGDVYVADYGNHRVVRWSPGATAGVVVAGATGQAGSALNRLNGPIDVFVDQAGQLFIADEQNHRVMRWALNATSGVLVAGSTGQVGPGLNQLHSPVRVFVSNSGLLYVSDISNNRVMRYAPGSSTGTVVAGGNGAGNGLRQLNTPIGIFVDENEAVFVADLQNNRVVKWNNGATVGQEVSNNDSLSTPNRVNQPRSLFVGPNKELFVVSNSQLLLKFGFDSMAPDLLIPENAGTYFIKMLTKQGCENSSSTKVISSPNVNLQSSGGFDVCEGDTTQLSTLQDVGYTYQWFKDGNQITGATSSTIEAFEPGLYRVEVLDSNSCSRVSESMRVWPKPTINLIADGVCLGTELRTNLPDSNVVQIDWFRNNQVFRSNKAAFKSNGSLYYGYINGLWVSDLEFQGSGLGDVHVHHDGSTYILAQTNQFPGLSVLKSTNTANAFHLVAGGNGFGNALNQIGSFSGAAPGGLFVAENGDIYIADRSNHRVVKWTAGAAQGVVVAGGNGSGSGLNQLNNPQSVYVNRTGDVFVVDQSNHRVVRWSPGANAGVVVAGGNGSGAGLNQFNNPRFITISTNGDIFVSDQNNHRVMRYATGASTGVVVAGGNFSGSALNQLNQPNGIAVDKSGNVFVADRFNNRIVRWAPDAVSGEVVAGLNLGNASGLDRTTRPVGLRLSSDYKLFVISVDSVNAMININSPNRLMSFGLDKLLTDSLIAQQGGDYRIRFTNVNGCSNSSDMLTIFDPQLTFPAIPNLCVTDAGLPLNMVSPTGGTYFGVGVDTGYFHPTIAGVGTHKLFYLYTDSNGCSKLDSQTIQVVPEPVVSIDTLGSMDICQGESVTLQSPLVSGQTYQWYRNGVLIPQATQRAYTVLDSVTAQYHVMVTRSVCEKSSDTLSVIVRPKPVVTIANLGAATICQGDSVILQAASDTDVSYQWYRNGQSLVGGTQATWVANQSGSYTCQVIKDNGCADTSNALSLTVLEYPSAQITPIGATTVCAGQIVVLNANQGAGLTHRWFRNGILIPGAVAASYQATVSGDYTVEVKRQQLCETLSQAVTVVVNPLPQISIAVTQGNQFCSGDSILITAQSTAQVLRYAWFRNGQLIPSDSTANFYATLPGYYHARVFDTAGCDNASDSVQLRYFDPPFANEAICAISVDTLTGRNMVVWEKTAGVRTAFFQIYREGAVTGQYIRIGRVPFDSLSVFIDTTANPLSQSHRYRLTTVDSCNFESVQSGIHRTIHLSSNIGVNNEVNLFWTAYEGITVPTHRILRSVNGGAYVEIAQVSGTTFTYTDLAPPVGQKNYLIEIQVAGGCNPSGLRTTGASMASSLTSVLSNRVAVGQGVGVFGLGWEGPKIYPSPSNGRIYLKLPASFGSNHRFEVYDARGRIVRILEVSDSKEPFEIDFSNEADGVYSLRSTSNGWTGRFLISK